MAGAAPLHPVCLQGTPFPELPRRDSRDVRVKAADTRAAAPARRVS